MPLQNFDSDMQVPFGHFHSDILHISFGFDIGILLFALLPILLLLLGRLLLPLLLVDLSCCCCCWLSAAVAGESALSNDDDDDDDGSDSAYTDIGFEINVSKPMSA